MTLLQYLIELVWSIQKPSASAVELPNPQGFQVPFLTENGTQIPADSICKGCRHYYGQMHRGVSLICAMHPYGAEESCLDWEAES